MKIVAISDVHVRWKNLVIPECDLLISAGDYSYHGEEWIVAEFHAWLNRQKAKHIISVQGNHETWVENNWNHALKIVNTVCPRAHFIQEGAVEIDGIKIYGSAITPRFFNWAWNRSRGEEIQPHWDMIPGDTNILITHGPPRGILDIVPYVDGTPKEHVGCEQLLKRVKEVKPALHIFGHIHHGHGEHHEDGTSFYNVAICDELYSPTNPITIIEYELNL